MSSHRVQLTKEWWGKNVNDRPAWRVEDLPQAWFKDVLLSLDLAYEIRRGTLVLGKPGTEPAVLVQSYFWEVVSCILKPYEPYAITGLSAFSAHMGNESVPKEIAVMTQNSSTRIELCGICVLIMEKQSDFFQSENADTCMNQIKTHKGYPLTIEAPESLLVRMRPQYLRDYPQVISAFLKAIDFNSEVLRTLLMQDSRPIVFARLAALFEQVGNASVAKLIRRIIKITTNYAAPGKSQILKHPLPVTLASKMKISDPVYITRFRDQLRIYRDRVELVFKDLEIPRWGVKKILTYAESTKKYDTYHSSTIEGYRVTQEEIQTLIEGRPTFFSGTSKEEIERNMALKGYLAAHQFVLHTVSQRFKKETTITETIIREIYAQLFSPSVEAGLLKKNHLVRYRNDAVYIRSSRHVPPNYQKVDDLMQCLVEEVNDIENQATRALLAHYGFVTIHPYFDGNGRTARLLMNYLLSLGGIPWITIRAEDREVYFRALEAAQCDEDINPFMMFLKRYFEESRALHLRG